MKKQRFLALFVVVLLFVAFLASPSFAALAVETASWSASDVQEINGHNPSADKTYLGERLIGLFTTETSSVTADGSMDLDIDDRVILFTTTADEGTNDATYANGEPKQQVTFVLVTDGGQDVTITPVTKTGFTSVSMDSAGDTCSLTYQDDTVGWVVSGNNSCTVTQ